MPDITTQADIKILIDSFYDRVRNDAMLGYIFNDVAHINWEHHLPRMYAFWEFLLLGKDTYRGNPFDVHKKLNGKVQLEKTHFDRWIELFTLSVDEQFAGLNAEEAKNKARLIAITWIPKFADQ